MANRSISALSLEQIPVAITAGGSNPTGDVVQLAVAPAAYASPTTWAAGSWTTVGGVYYANVLVGPGSTVGALAPGVYNVWVKITDNPEVPVLKSPDTLTVF